jgi:hypothetical protein
MEEKILRSIIRYIPDLVDLALKERPDADRGSVEVAAAIMMLTATMCTLNKLPRTSQRDAIIGKIIDNLPRILEDRDVDLRQSILEPEILELATKSNYGACHTNLLGAYDAIYNTRISNDLARIESMSKGPFGEVGSLCAVTVDALIGRGKTTDTIQLVLIYNKHKLNILDAIKGDSNSGNTTGSKSCFVATACFGSPHQKTVVTLRQFREVVLKKHALGRLFVKSYYQFSPSLAEAIKHSPVLRYPITIILTLVARLLRRCFYLDKH